MKPITTRIKVLGISAAALLATMAISTPAFASTGYYQRHFTYSFAGLTCYLKGWTPTTAKPPVAQKPVTPAPGQPPVAQKPVTPAPVTPAQPPAPAKPADNTAGLTPDEQQMLNLVNSERSKAGLAPLQADPQLTKLARMKSQDMISHNYFSHQSPTYGSPFDMMKSNGVSYRTAGENIAGNGSVAGAHTALMNSAGHRANILNGGFKYVGIGIIKGGQYGMMFTQQFVGR